MKIHQRTTVTARALLVFAVLFVVFLLLRSFFSRSCTYTEGGMAVSPAESIWLRNRLERLVNDYESGQIPRDAFRSEVAKHEDSTLPNELNCSFSITTLLKARSEPYRISSDISVLRGATLVIDEGVEIIMAPDITLTVAGRIYAVGSQQAPIRIHGGVEGGYETISLEHGPNQFVWTEVEGGRKLLSISHDRSARTLVEESKFNSWSDLAIEHRNTAVLNLARWILKYPIDRIAGEGNFGGLYVLRSRFGLETPLEKISGETIRARFPDGLTIQESEFGIRRGYNDVINLTDCIRNSWPLIIGNRFNGGSDDAIDLDSCSAFVVGNRIHNFRPEDPSGASSNANGGGITGSSRGSNPVIINNVIDSCFHAIGFKDGARPIIVNNTITNSNIGVTLYQSEPEAPLPFGIMINNILWNNVSWSGNGEPQDVVLSGGWWPSYNQETGQQASIDAQYNIISTMPRPFAGVENRNDNPMLEYPDGIPSPAPGSLAIGSGLGTLSFSDVPMEDFIEFLSTDFFGKRRLLTGSSFSKIDRGAVEVGWQERGVGIQTSENSTGAVIAGGFVIPNQTPAKNR